jgi:hypothetical protein
MLREALLLKTNVVLNVIRPVRAALLLRISSTGSGSTPAFVFRANPSVNSYIVLKAIILFVKMACNPRPGPAQRQNCFPTHSK